MKPLLPIIQDRNQYSELFVQNAIWEKPIQYLADKHNLVGEPTRSTRGSHIVYRVGNSWIKIMTPLFAKDMAFEVAGLKTIDGRLSVHAPQIHALGTLEDWHYIILSHVEGHRIGDVWSNFDTQEKALLARQMAATTLEMQACSPDPAVFNRGDWQEFIRERIKNVKAHHLGKNLNAAWLDKLPLFINQFHESEFTGTKEVFLHADLTWDHFLVGERNGMPFISGVIDLADCRMGHPEYDIPASAAFIFKNEPASFHEYMLGLGYSKNVLNPRMSEKILAWTCLHLYSNLNTYFTNEMAMLSPGEYSSLAARVFSLE